MKTNRLLTGTVIVLVFALVIGFAGGCDTATLEQRNCVAMIGDSIFALSGQITRHLQEISHQRYRTYYISGAQMAGGMVPDIEAQYNTASRAGKIRTLIMDGGGNDFLMGNRANPDRIAQEIAEAFGRILDKAKNDGVENVVVLGYYKTISSPAGFLEDAASQSAALEAAGASRGINLAFVNPNADPWFSSRNPAQYTVDTIHPTTAAANKLAELIWNEMVTNDIEQGPGCTASSSSSSGGCN